MSESGDRVEVVRQYHARTAHRLNAYAKGPETLDWDHQPNPFRRFAGSPVRTLPILTSEHPLSWAELHAAPLPPQTVTLEHIAALLQLAVGLSAWKEYGPSRWALRQNPSSGNLHPTETYVVAQGLDTLANGVYHYVPERHALEQRCAGNILVVEQAPNLLIGLSSIAWREAWKYGERAYRYVQLDVGHALGSLRYSAALLGWKCEMVNTSDRAIATLLGLDRETDFEDAEAETPDLLLRIIADSHGVGRQLHVSDEPLLWQGKANALGGEPHLEWPIIGAMESTCFQHSTWRNRNPPDNFASVSHPCGLSTQSLMQRRRSAQAFDGKTRLSLDALMPLLQAIANVDALPMDVWPTSPRIHPILIVHRVDELKPGLYALPRSAAGHDLMQQSMRCEFLWEPATDDANSPLFGLIYANATNAARVISCHQAIASDSVLALSLLAEFDSALEADPAEYRRLHWEAGLLGQQLYLQAEALDLQGTGIGCFFDDSLHETLGIEDSRLRVVYHFTIGKGVFDSRIRTVAPYRASVQVER